ncbi:hydrolase [Siccirubricoccus deserti]|uniref:Alpha/beta hydrolase n=1 Tax=Siccirubricoccus deserti TaxID=2013562 RepID=A0A9X0UFT2_9PROT|nr:alpha/beta hydrolase [Siccirubricoccus deserti]MBC4018223.1 alpha/beta hydrolase [Siccirubricoccus deserti]GGC63555.1 hydrolase [Siccirubricoccus deserti]
MSYPELQKLVDALRARPVITDIGERRRAFDAFATTFPPAADVTVETLELGGVMAERSRTPGDDAAGAILYVHGGGYVFGSLDSHRHVVTEIGRAAGVPGYALHYRLAPEHPFPAPVEDTVAAYRALLAQGIAPGRIALAGDSAGGGLVVAALVAFREAGLPQPACGWSISPWIDLEALGPSMTGNAASDPSVQRDPILELARLYLAGADPRSPLAAPLYADLKGIAPLLIQVGAIETLLDDAVRLAGRAAAAGVPTRLDVWPEMPHVWHLFHPVLTAGRKAIEQGGAFVKAAMQDGAPFTYRG